MTPNGDGTAGRLGWLLDNFVRGAPGVVHAVLASGDGLQMAASAAGFNGRFNDQLSAATAGLVSLARGIAQLLQFAPLTQTIVETAGGMLFVTPISDRATLVVVADRNCDMGRIGYEMTMLAAQVGHAVTPAAREGTRVTKP